MTTPCIVKPCAGYFEFFLTLFGILFEFASDSFFFGAGVTQKTISGTTGILQSLSPHEQKMVLMRFLSN